MGAKANLYKFVDGIRETYSLSNTSYNIKISNLCSIDPTIWIETHYFSTTGFGAAIFFGDKKDTIILNSQRTPQEQYFDFCHELIHKHKHRTNDRLSYNCFTISQNSFIEWEANEGAAEMLMPYRSFIQDVAEAYPTFSASYDIHDFKCQMQQKYNVTPTMVELRLNSLRYEIWQIINNVPINEIEILSRKELEKRNIEVVSVNDLENRHWLAECERWKHRYDISSMNLCQNVVL